MHAIVLGDIEWILDSGATDHACNDRTAFTKFTHKVQNIAVADGKYCRCEGIGEVAGISNVNYIPTFVCNLLSIPQLCMDGWKVTFLHRTCILERDDIRIQASNTAKDGLFRLSTDREGQWQQEQENETQQVESENDFIITDYRAYASTSAGEKRHRDQQERHTTQVPYSDLQHQRWGHAYIERLKAAQKHKLITGFTKEIKPCSVCDACKLANLTYTTLSRTPRTANVRRDYGPLQKIVSDVKGPIHIVGIKGVRIYILYMAAQNTNGSTSSSTSMLKQSLIRSNSPNKTPHQCAKTCASSKHSNETMQATMKTKMSCST